MDEEKCTNGLAKIIIDHSNREIYLLKLFKISIEWYNYNKHHKHPLGHISYEVITIRKMFL